MTLPKATLRAIEKFHRQRRMFCIVNKTVFGHSIMDAMIAPFNDPRAHKEWLQNAIPEHADFLLVTAPRGFVYKDKLCIYYGYNFAPVSNEEAKRVVECIANNTLIDLNTEVYNGMNTEVQKLGQLFTPLQKLGTIKDILNIDQTVTINKNTTKEEINQLFGFGPESTCG